ncbi:MAG: hypothetical protein KAJ07_11885 [Planctomycetes bacterium]|nr:hypothetical protein [Planctomycetota bacterium]
MVNDAKKSGNQKDSSLDALAKDFVRGLDNEHKMLVVLKAQLYGGSWLPMLDDLQNRLEGKPYIFKLSTRIKDDVQRIEQMKAFEESNGIDLAEYVSLT